jgi:hypothetical protein
MGHHLPAEFRNIHVPNTGKKVNSHVTGYGIFESSKKKAPKGWITPSGA